MKEYRLSEIVTALTLDGQEVKRMTLQKKMALRAISVAIEFDTLLAMKNIGKEDVLSCMKRIKSLHFRHLKQIEENSTKDLLTEGILKKKLKLLSCDMNYYTAGVEILEYSTNREFYSKEVEFLRSEMLEPGTPSIETIALFAILREAGVVHDLFSINEQNEIEKRFVELAKDEKIAEFLTLDFHSDIQKLFSRFIVKKRSLFKNPYLQGVAIIFPFLDRRESIFIDFVVLQTEFSSRQDAVIEFLKKKGFDAEKYQLGELSLLRIDNMLYRTFSSSRMCKLPIQGMVIQPYYG